jgi:predicted porin
MTNKLQMLFDHDIHFSVESYPSIGFTFYLGDRFNGVANYKSFDSFNDGVNWLWDEAMKRNPNNKCFENKF